MASGNRPIADAKMTVRIPEPLKMVLEALGIAKCLTLSDIVRQLLETHPIVVNAADVIYNGLEDPEHPAKD